MKITIDTKEDSHEEIRKIIKMLSSLVGERETFSNQPNIFEDDDMDKESSESQPTNAFANIFGSEPSTPSEEDKESTEDEEVKVEEGEDVPEVEEYH